MNTKEQYDQYMMTSMVPAIEPIVVSRAERSTLYGEDGKEYLDCFSGISVTNAGHGHPKILAAAKEQMDLWVHSCTYMYYNSQAGALAQKLAELTPGNLQKSFFGNSGAEAVEGAVRLVRFFTGRSEIMSLTHSFHGRTAGALALTGQRGRKGGPGPLMPGVSFAPAPYCYRCPLGLKYPDCGVACAQEVKKSMETSSDGKLAAFIAEPILGEGGIIVPPKEYFEIVQNIVKEEGALFIADEVQTGFGRTGTMFAIEPYEVEPDIMIMAKGIANGFPLGAFIASPDIGNAFPPGSHLSTFGGNPVSCAAAVANIDVLVDEKLPQNAASLGIQLMVILNKFKEKWPLIGDVRGKGLMIGLELIKDKDKTPAVNEAKEIRRICREAGVLVGVGGFYGNVVRLQPPLVMTEDEAAHAAEILGQALDQVSEAS